MKIRPFLIPMMVFFAFLLFGRWTGVQIQKSVLASGLTDEEMLQVEVEPPVQPLFFEGSFAPLSSSGNIPHPFADNETRHKRQKNLLIIGVDDLSNSQPTLIGIWLVLYLPDRPLVTLMPVYPMVSTQPGRLQFTSDEGLSSSFRLNSNGSPHPELLDKLRDKGLWWTNYAVIDGTALENLFHLARNPSSPSGPKMGHDASAGTLSRLPAPAEEPQKALLSQAHAIQELCHTRNLTMSPRQVTELIRNMQGHLATDISANQVIDDLKSMLLNGGGFICEFPSLKMDAGSL